MDVELANVQTADGVRLDGYLRMPSAMAKPRLGVDIVICHHGVRSAHVVGYLRQKGFRRAINLAGGIDLWTDEVDRELPRY